MKLWITALALAAATAACGGAGGRGDATPRLEVVAGERIDVRFTSDGETLPIYHVDGRPYLLGEEGRRYAIHLYNRTEARLEAVVSVDGRDAISGRVADYREHRGYVLLPGEEIAVEGFRKSLEGVAAFEFAPPEDSYAARMGTSESIGVIGVALFEEDEGARPRPVPIAGGGGAYDAKRAPAAAPSEGAALAEEAADEGQGLGTRYGDEIDSEAEVVPFRRLDPDRPAELIAVRYDDREGLESAGVIFDDGDLPADDPGGPDPFPGVPRDDRFAPPPP